MNIPDRWHANGGGVQVNPARRSGAHQVAGTVVGIDRGVVIIDRAGDYQRIVDGIAVDALRQVLPLQMRGPIPSKAIRLVFSKIGLN